MTPRRWIRLAIAISLGAALATLPALPAVSQEAPTVELGDTATLAARGADYLSPSPSPVQPTANLPIFSSASPSAEEPGRQRKRVRRQHRLHG